MTEKLIRPVTATTTLRLCHHSVATHAGDVSGPLTTSENLGNPMVKLPGEAYLKSPDRSERVLIFGKSNEKIQIDLENGISRFGGFFREPNYSEAHLISAGILLENAKQRDELDELGLPIFYLSRHAMELKLKDLLSLAYEICDLRRGASQISNINQNIPTNGQIKRCRVRS